MGDFLFLYNSSAWGWEEKTSINVGIKIHGHIEPTCSLSLDFGEINLVLKTGIIYDEGTFIIIPGIFSTYNLEKFQFHTGLEGFFALGTLEYLILWRIGGLYYLPISNFSLGIGGEIGIPINYFFSIIPTLIVNLSF